MSCRRRAASHPLAPSRRFYVAVPADRVRLDFLIAVGEVGWRLHQELVWLKDAIVLGQSDYHYRHEPILYGYTPGTGTSGRPTRAPAGTATTAASTSSSTRSRRATASTRP